MTMQRRFCIYYIMNANRKAVYVGQSVDPARRWAEHMTAAKRPRVRVHRWMAAEIAAGRMPYYRVVKWCFGDHDYAKQMECWYFDRLQTRQCFRRGPIVVNDIHP